MAATTITPLYAYFEATIAIGDISTKSVTELSVKVAGSCAFTHCKG